MQFLIFIKYLHKVVNKTSIIAERTPKHLTTSQIYNNYNPKRMHIKCITFTRNGTNTYGVLFTLVIIYGRRVIRH